MGIESATNGLVITGIAKGNGFERVTQQSRRTALKRLLSAMTYRLTLESQ
jgi:hypothetical protein